MMFEEVSVVNSIYCSRKNIVCEENAFIILSHNENKFQVCRIV